MTIKINHFKTRVVRYPLLAISFLCALITTGLHSGLDKAEWAYWVGAMGSVGAIAAAIWLATREDVRKHKNAYALAQFTAAGIELPLSRTYFAVGAFSKLLDEQSHNLPPRSWIHPISHQELEKIAAAIATLRIWSPEELHPLVVFPDRCADKLNRAFGIIQSVPTVLTGYQALGNDENLLKYAASENAKSLERAHVLIFEALSVIRSEAALTEIR